MAKYAAGYLEINPRIVETVHEMVNAHRASINLAPLEFAPVDYAGDCCRCKREPFVVNTRRLLIRRQVFCVACRKLWTFDQVRDAMSKAGRTRRPTALKAMAAGV